MRYRWEIMGRLAAEKVVAIVRERTPDDARSSVARLLDSGATVLEVSMTTPSALTIVENAARPGRLVGVGTVLDAETAAAAARSGASFIVTPTLSPGTIAAAHRHGMAALVGCGTATEILTALECGADAVKLFPANASSPSVLRSLREPLPQAPVIPTGGVTLDTAPEWLSAGAIAVGLGGALTRNGVDVAAALASLRHPRA